MKKFMKLLFPALLILSGCLLSGCDKTSEDIHHIKVGVINGAEQDVAEVAKQVALKKYGLHVELVGFSGSLLPNDPPLIMCKWVIAVIGENLRLTVDTGHNNVIAVVSGCG